MPSGGVGPHDVAVGVQGQQAVAVVSGLVARPVQAQDQGVRVGQQPAVFDAAGRAAHQVFQGRALGGLDAGQVQHARAQAIGPEHRRTRAAVNTGVLKKVLAPVQPDRLQLGQGGADGGGAHGFFGQIHPHPGDHLGAAVLPVHRAVHVDHDAFGIGQDGEIAYVGNGPGQLHQHRLGRLHQGAAGFLHASHVLGRDGLKAHGLPRLQAHAQTALPRLGDPG